MVTWISHRPNMSQFGLPIYLGQSCSFSCIVCSVKRSTPAPPTRNTEVMSDSWPSLLSKYKWPFHCQFCLLPLSWTHCLPLSLFPGFESGLPRLSAGLLQWPPTCFPLLESILLHDILVFLLKHQSDHIILHLNYPTRQILHSKNKQSECTGHPTEETNTHLCMWKVHHETNVTVTSPRLSNWQNLRELVTNDCESVCTLTYRCWQCNILHGILATFWIREGTQTA